MIQILSGIFQVTGYAYHLANKCVCPGSCARRTYDISHFFQPNIVHKRLGNRQLVHSSGDTVGVPKSGWNIITKKHAHTHNRMCPWYPTRWRHMFCIRSSTIGVSYFSMYYVFTLLFDVPLKIYNSAFRRLLLEFWPIAESAYVQQNIPKLRAYQLHRRPRTLITSSEAEGSCFFLHFPAGKSRRSPRGLNVPYDFKNMWLSLVLF